MDSRKPTDLLNDLNNQIKEQLLKFAQLMRTHLTATTHPSPQFKILAENLKDEAEFFSQILAAQKTKEFITALEKQTPITINFPSNRFSKTFENEQALYDYLKNKADRFDQLYAKLSDTSISSRKPKNEDETNISSAESVLSFSSENALKKEKKKMLQSSNHESKKSSSESQTDDTLSLGNLKQGADSEHSRDADDAGSGPTTPRPKPKS